MAARDNDTTEPLSHLDLLRAAGSLGRGERPGHDLRRHDEPVNTGEPPPVAEWYAVRRERLLRIMHGKELCRHDKDGRGVAAPLVAQLDKERTVRAKARRIAADVERERWERSERVERENRERQRDRARRGRSDDHIEADGIEADDDD